MKQIILTLMTFFLISNSLLALDDKLSQKEQEALEEIRLSNTVIDLSNQCRENLRIYVQLIAQIRQNIDQSFELPLDEEDHKQDYRDAIQNTHDFEEKEILKANIDKALQLQQTVTKQALRLKNETILLKEQATPNNELEEVITKLQGNIEKSEEQWGNIFRQARRMGNRAEIVLLARNPLADFVVPMKTDLMELVDCINTLRIEGEFEYSNLPNLEELEKAINKHEKIINKKSKKLRSPSYKQVYQNFYQNCRQSLTDIRKLIELKSAKVPDDTIRRWQEILGEDYKKMVKDYNTFISQ